MPQPQQQENPVTVAQGLNMAYIAATVHAACIMPWLRSRPGTHAYANTGPLALIAMVFYAAFANCPEMLDYIPIWLVAVIFRRITSDRTQHSRYYGVPLLTRWFACGPVTAMKMEVIVMLAAVLLLPISEPLGLFFLAETISLTVILVIEGGAQALRRRRMHDASIEHEATAEMFHEE